MGNQGLLSALGYAPNVSPAGELCHMAEPRGPYSTGYNKKTSSTLGESDLWTKFHEGVLAIASAPSHSEKDNHISMTLGANCGSAGASGCYKGFTEV